MTLTGTYNVFVNLLNVTSFQLFLPRAAKYYFHY